MYGFLSSKIILKGKETLVKQVDILISKNQVLQIILYHVASYSCHLQYSDTIWVVNFKG